jgi:hypothetical protein
MKPGSVTLEQILEEKQQVPDVIFLKGRNLAFFLSFINMFSFKTLWKRKTDKNTGMVDFLRINLENNDDMS